MKVNPLNQFRYMMVFYGKLFHFAKQKTSRDKVSEVEVGVLENEVDEVIVKQ